MEIYCSEIDYSSVCNYGFQFVLPRPYKGISILQEQVHYWGAMNSGNQNSHWSSFEISEDSRNTNNYTGNSSVNTFDFGFSDLYHEDFNLGSDFNDAPSLDDIQVTPMDDPPRRKEENHDAVNVTSTTFSAGLGIQLGRSTAQSNLVGRQHSIRFEQPHNELSGCASSSGCSDQEFISNYVIGNVYKGADYPANIFPNRTSYDNFTEIPSFQEDMQQQKVSMHVVTTDTMKSQEQQSFERQFFLPSFNQHQFETSQFNQTVQDNIKTNISNDSVTPIVIATKHHSIDHQMTMTQNTSHQSGGFQNQTQRNEEIPYESTTVFNTSNIASYSGSCNRFTSSTHDKTIPYGQDALYNPHIAHSETDTQQTQQYFDNQCIPLWEDDSLANNVFNNLPSSMQRTEYRQKEHVHKGNIQYQRTIPVINVTDHTGKIDGQNTVRQHGNSNLPNANFISPYQPDLGANEIIEIVDEGNVRQLNINNNGSTFSIPNTSRLQQMNTDKGYREVLLQEQDMKRLQRIEQHPLVKEKQHQYGNEQHHIQMEQQQHFDFEKQHFQMGQQYVQLGQQHLQIEQQQHLHIGQLQHLQTGQQQHQQVEHHQLDVVGQQQHLQDRQNNHKQREQKYLQVEQQQLLQMGQESHHPSHLIQHHLQIQHSNQQKQQLLNLGQQQNPQKLLCTQYDAQQKQRQVQEKHFSEVEQLGQLQPNFVLQDLQLGQHQYVKREQQKHEEKTYQVEQKQEQQRKIDQEQRRLLFSVKNERYQSNVVKNTNHQTNIFEVNQDQRGNQLCFQQDAVQQQFLYHQTGDQKIIAHMQYENTKSILPATVYSGGIIQNNSNQYVQDNFISPQDVNFGIASYIPNDALYEKDLHSRSKFSTQYNKHSDEQYHKYDNPSIKELLVAPNQQPVTSASISLNIPIQHPTTNVEIMLNENSTYLQGSSRRSLINQVEKQAHEPSINCQSVESSLEKLLESSKYVTSPSLSCKMPSAYETDDMNFEISGLKENSQYIADFSTTQIEEPRSIFEYSMDLQSIPFQNNTKDSLVITSTQSHLDLQSGVSDIPSSSCNKPFEFTSAAASSRPSSVASDLFRELDFPLDCGDFCEWFLAENLNSLGDAATIEPFESVRPSSVMNRLEDLNFVDSNTLKEDKFAIKRGRGRPRKNIVESESLKNYSAETSGNISASMKCLEPDKRERSRKPPFLSVSMEGIKSSDYSVKHELQCRSRPMDRSHREKKTRSTERERLLDIAKRKPDVSSSLIGGCEPLTLYDRAKTNQRGAARQANERLKASRNREIEELNSSYLKPPLVCEKKTSPLKKATKLSPRTTDKTKKSTTVRQHGEITENNVYEVKKVKTKDDCIKHIAREEDKIETSICKQFNKKSNKASTCYTWKDKNYSNGFLLIPKISYVAKTNGKSEQNDVQIGLIISDLYEAEHEIIKQQNTQGNVIFMNTINEYNIPCTSNVLATDLIFPSDQVPFSETQEVSTTYDGSTGWNLAGLDLETLEELREWMLFDFPPPLLHVPPVPVLLPSQVKAQMRSDHKQDTVDAELKEISWPKPNEYTTGKTFDGFQNWFPKQIKVSQHDYLDLPILFEPPLSREEFYAEYLKPMNELYMKTIKEKKRHIFTPWPKPDVKYSFTCDLLPIRTVKCGHSLPYLDLCNQILSCKPRIKERDPLDDHYLRVLKERKERQITVSNVIESIVNRVLFLEDWPIIPKQQFSILYHGRLEESIIHHTPELVPAYLNIHTRHPKIDEIYTVDISLERDDSYEITKIYVEFQKEYCCEQLCLFENSKELYFEMIIQAETCEKIIPISRKYSSSLAVSDIDVMKTYQSEYSSTTTTFDIATMDRKMLSVSTVNYKLSSSLLVNESIERTIAYSHMETSSLNIFDIHADMQRNHRITKDATFVNVLKNLEFFSCYIIDLNINLINKEVNNGIEKLLPVQVYAEDSLHIFTVQVIRRRQMEVKQHSIVRNIALGDFASFSVCSHVFCITEKQPSIKRNKGCEFIYPIAREKTVSFHMATTRFSRKRKMERADAIVVKKLALEDQVGFIVAVMDNQNQNNFREVTIMKDPRLPIKIARSVKEVEKKWIILAKYCQIPKITPSVDQMSLAVLLQDLFANAMKIENTMTMKDLNDFITHQTHIFGFQFQKYTLADIEAKLNLELLSNFHVWDEFVKKSHARRAKYGVDRERLATLFLFLGSPRLPLFGRPWRQWLSPLTYKSTSTLANNLAICCRQITLSGMDDLEYSSQACKLWWVFMMCRDVVPWSVYPALTRRQLFMFVRLLEVLSDIKKPAFCFYPPRQFFEAVRLMMEHPKIHTIPKDIYHPDVTTFVSLKKSNEFRVFDIGHSLPDILCYWMDDMDRLDGYLHGDICIAHFDNNMFPSQTEWIWMNYGRDVQRLVFPKYTKEEIINKIDDYLTDSKISLNLRKKISLFKNALEIDQNLNKSSIDLMPFDLLDPFALSPTFIDHIPISEQFQKDFHDAICQALINKNQLHHQLLRKKDIVNLLKWNKRTSESIVIINFVNILKMLFSWKDLAIVKNYHTKLIIVHFTVYQLHVLINWGRVLHHHSSNVLLITILSILSTPILLGECLEKKLIYLQNSSTAHSAHKLFGAGRATTIISSNNFNIHKISKNLQSTPSTSSYVKDVERNFNTEKYIYIYNMMVEYAENLVLIYIYILLLDFLELIHSAISIALPRLLSIRLIEFRLCYTNVLTSSTTMMKHQLRVLGKRRWVEIHKRRYDKELFNKFIRTKDISEVKMFEKINLLKAEQDMEHILGITRAEAREMEISALRDSRTPLFNSYYLKDVDKWDSRCVSQVPFVTVDATNSVAFHHSSGLVLEPAYAYMTQMKWGYEKGMI
uniref:C2H2-type domain-containing protein n=1 Tax=Heterorhabditis bacteriophora TaxID=37862 RepID=A0A1I7WUT1_HETBA